MKELIYTVEDTGPVDGKSKIREIRFEVRREEYVLRRELPSQWEIARNREGFLESWNRTFLVDAILGFYEAARIRGYLE